MIRTMSYYLTFFIVTNLIRDRRQLNLLINGIFLLATIVALVMVVQYLVGSSVSILPGRVEVLTTQGINYNDVTRILPPGVAILLVAFLASLCVLLLEKKKSFVVLKFLQFGLFGLALLFTFLRSYWGVLIIAFLLLIIILRGQERRKFVNWGLGILLSSGIILTIVFNIPNRKVVGLVNASVERLQTIFSLETYQGQDSSLNWRSIENGYAVDQIIAHPILGSGMGSTYRPYDSRLDTPTNNLRWFIHNGHLRILLDSGIIGYLAFIVLSLVFLIRGFRN
jgi:O-antigen ligase